jgi:hypothetical protein
MLYLLSALPEKRRKPTELPMEIIMSLLLSVYTDRQYQSEIRSVYTEKICPSVYTDRIADGLYSFFEKLQRCDEVDFFFRQFYRRNDRGIQTGISVQWRGTVTSGLTGGYTDGTCPSVNASVKANIYPLCRHSLPLFLLLLPHPNSPLPNCSQPPIPTLPLFSTQALKFLILLYVVTTFVLRAIYCGFYRFL